jgi:hypothetical protein
MKKVVSAVPMEQRNAALPSVLVTASTKTEARDISQEFPCIICLPQVSFTRILLATATNQKKRNCDKVSTSV